MDRDSLERARRRLEEVRGGNGDSVAVEAVLERAKTALAELAERTAELEAAVPERLGSAIEDGMRAQVLPVARHVAETRGLSTQAIRRLERIQGDVEAERLARVEDLRLLVELISSGWRGVDRRLDRIERSFDRLERSLDRPPAELYRFEDRPEQQSGA